MGFFFFLSGLIMSVIFGSMADFSFITDLDGEKANATGTITGVEETSSRENKVDIMRYTYEFIAVDGKRYEGESYYPGDFAIVKGDTVTIEYTIPRPAASRIAGMRTAPFSGVVPLFILIFP